MMTTASQKYLCFVVIARVCLTKKAEPPPTHDVNRDSGTAMTNGGWLRRLVRHQRRKYNNHIRQIQSSLIVASHFWSSETVAPACGFGLGANCNLARRSQPTRSRKPKRCRFFFPNHRNLSNNLTNSKLKPILMPNEKS
jgi:hypothetical protein